VRDLLLGRPVCDLDLAVEGDAASFARALAGKIGGRVREHGRFATATLELPGGGRCDVAAARSETYARPGALPKVRPASIAEDLARRDFTVNAMAIELGPPGRVRVLDPFGGSRDLTERTLRFLHPRSPCDDPTRAFRAVRYANRLGFRVAPDSIRAVRVAIAEGAFDAISGDRLRRELDLIFAEPDPAGAVARMGALGLVPIVGDGLSADARTLARLRRAEALVREGKAEASGLLFLLVWASLLRKGELGALADRLALNGAPGRSVRQWESTWRRLAGLRTERRRSRIRRLASGLSAAEIGALAAGLDRRKAARLCDTALRPVRLSIGGRDLVAAGVPAGPSVGRALEATLEAREDGMIGPGEELDFALRCARGRDPLP
jgi:tRNA nucleotidyltransferase (CCA-adding enzyme)